jgi:hypothetical protein
MAVLTPTPKMQFESAAGVPLSGGKVYTYAAGTTTPQATFTDYTGATPNANPIILNSRGEAAIWLGSASYKFKLTDANDVEIWTVDYISAPTSGVSPVLSGNVVIDSDTPSPALKITQTGTGAVLRVQDSVDPDATPFVIDNSGNVGIGTATPSAQLETTGAAKFASATITTPLGVASGGTGLATLTANNVVLGNGASAPTFVAPGTAGNLLTSDGTTWASSTPAAPLPSQTGNSGKVLTTNGTAASWGSSIIAGTAQTPTTTNADFTGIPSWVRRITVAFSGLSTNASTAVTLRLGTGGVFATTGYVCDVWQGGSGNTAATSTTDFLLDAAGQTAATSRNGSVVLNNVSGNIWVASGLSPRGSGIVNAMTGTVTLGGVLDSVRLLSGGGNLFDAGTVNVFWE